MGYLGDSQGIANRFINQDGAWNEHLQHTCDFVTGILKNKSVRNLAVLGSGWLLDLPLKQVAQLAGHITLYDVVHPPQILHQIKKYENIKAVTVDITGGFVMAAYDAVKKYRKTGNATGIEELVVQGFLPDLKADYVVSLNALSQLGTLINEYLVMEVAYTEDDQRRLNRLIQEGHIRMLQKTSSCLITDYEEITTDLKTGNEKVRSLIETEIPGSVYAVRWDWNFDANGDFYAGKKVVLKVMALEF